MSVDELRWLKEDIKRDRCLFKKTIDLVQKHITWVVWLYLQQTISSTACKP